MRAWMEPIKKRRRVKRGVNGPPPFLSLPKFFLFFHIKNRHPQQKPPMPKQKSPKKNLKKSRRHTSKKGSRKTPKRGRASKRSRSTFRADPPVEKVTVDGIISDLFENKTVILEGMSSGLYARLELTYTAPSRLTKSKLQIKTVVSNKEVSNETISGKANINITITNIVNNTYKFSNDKDSYTFTLKQNLPIYDQMSLFPQIKEITEEIRKKKFTPKTKK